MKTRSLFVRTLVVLAVMVPVLFFAAPFLQYFYFSLHWEGEETRKAIYAEADTLMQAPKKDLTRIELPPWEKRPDVYFPKHLPKTIATLKPMNVSIQSDCVDIQMHAGFDEVSGYLIPRKSTQFKPLNRPGMDYKPIGDGVWWYHFN